MLRPALACALAALTFTACLTGETPLPPLGCVENPDTCACTRNSDCGSGFACIASKCERLCNTDGDCSEGLVCEDAICRRPGCGSDAECGEGLQCLAGECRTPVPASEVASCSIQPSRALLAPGKSRTFSIQAHDASGRGLPWKGAARWASGDPARATVRGTTHTGTAVPGIEGEVEVRASITGGPDCTPAVARAYGPVPVGRIRVVVADLQGLEPVPNAKVVVSQGTQTLDAKTDESGVALLDFPGDAPRTISAYEPLHSYVTAFGVRGRDIALFLKPFPQRRGFTGGMKVEDFDGLPVQGEKVRMAVFGASLPGNLLDLQGPTVFGDLVMTNMNLGPATMKVALPSGVVVGMDDEMFRERFEVFASPGLRTVWGLGGNASFNELFDALSPLIVADQADVSTGALVNLLIPLVNRFHSGVVVGRPVPTTQELEEISVPLATPLRMKLKVRVPELPQYGFEGETRRFEDALVVGAALHRPQGLVPLGLAAGSDRPGENGPLDGLVTNPEPGGADGTLPLRVAPLNAGLETSTYALVALAGSFTALGPGGDGTPIVVSGLVTAPPSLPYTARGLEVSFPRGFLGVPSAPRLTERHFALGSLVEGATFHRLDVGSAWNGEWQIYFPPTGHEFDVPVPPPGYDDRLRVPSSAAQPLVRVQSVALDAAAGPRDYQGVVAFDGDDLDDLTVHMQAFSSRELVR